MRRGKALEYRNALDAHCRPFGQSLRAKAQKYPILVFPDPGSRTSA